MKTIIIALIVSSTVQINFVESGIILDKISSRLTHTRQVLKCGLHTVGSTILKHHHQNDPCHDQERADNTNRLDNDELATYPSIDLRGKFKTPETLDASENSIKLSTPTEATGTIVPQGKRIIAVGSNCPSGFRGDGKGNCREEY